MIELEEDDSDGEEVQEESHTEAKDPPGVGDDDDDDLQVVYDDGHLENVEEFNRILNMDGLSDECQVIKAGYLWFHFKTTSQQF